MNSRSPRLGPRTAALVLAAGVGALVFATANHPRPSAPNPSGAINADWTRRLASLREATPEAVAQAAVAAAAARATLETADQFNGQLHSWSSSWRVERKAEGNRSGLEVRSYRLTANDRSPKSWSTCLELLRALAGTAGVSIEHLTLNAAPMGDGGFTLLAAELTIRLRP